MTSPRLARPTRVARDHVEWYRHARVAFIIHVQMGRPLPGRPAGALLRRWYMLGRAFV